MHQLDTEHALVRADRDSSHGQSRKNGSTQGPYSLALTSEFVGGGVGSRLHSPALPSLPHHNYDRCVWNEKEFLWHQSIWSWATGREVDRNVIAVSWTAALHGCHKLSGYTLNVIKQNAFSNCTHTHVLTQVKEGQRFMASRCVSVTLAWIAAAGVCSCC